MKTIGIEDGQIVIHLEHLRAVSKPPGQPLPVIFRVTVERYTELREIARRARAAARSRKHLLV